MIHQRPVLKKPNYFLPGWQLLMLLQQYGHDFLQRVAPSANRSCLATAELLQLKLDGVNVRSDKQKGTQSESPDDRFISPNSLADKKI